MPKNQAPAAASSAGDKHRSSNSKQQNGPAAKGGGGAKGGQRAGGSAREWDARRHKQQQLELLTKQAEENARILGRERAALLAVQAQDHGPQSAGQQAHRPPPAPAAPRVHNFLDQPARIFDASQVPGLSGGSGGGGGNNGHSVQHAAPPPPPYPGHPGEAQQTPGGGAWQQQQQQHGPPEGQWGGGGGAAGHWDGGRHAAHASTEPAPWHPQYQQQQHHHQVLSPPQHHHHQAQEAWAANAPSPQTHSPPGWAQRQQQQQHHHQHQQSAQHPFAPPSNGAPSNAHAFPGFSGGPAQPQQQQHHHQQQHPQAWHPAPAPAAQRPPALSLPGAQAQQHQHHHHMGPASPSSHPPLASPSNMGLGRKFMGAMAQLRAGPSQEQSEAAATQRAQWLRELDEQVRFKKDQEARRKAEERAQQAKEEAELQAHYQRLQEQEQADRQASQHQQQQRQQQQQEQAPPGRHASHARPQPQAHHPYGGQQQQHAVDDQDHKPARLRRGGAKTLVDADWLDNIPKQQQQQQQQQQGHEEYLAGPVAAPAPAQPAGRHPVVSSQREGHARGADGSPGSGGGGPWSGVGDAAARVVVRPGGQDGGAGDGGGDGDVPGGVEGMLVALQREQVRLREEFAQQLASLQHVAAGAGAVAADRQRAWQDVERVRGKLMEGPARDSGVAGRPDGPGAGGGQAGGLPVDAAGQFVVSTHLLPKDAAGIPERLATPLEAEWAAAYEPLLKSRSFAGVRPPSPPTVWRADPTASPRPVLYSSTHLMEDSLQLSSSALEEGEVWGAVHEVPEAGSPTWAKGAPRRAHSAGSESSGALNRRPGAQLLGSAGGQRPPGLYRHHSEVRNAPPTQIPRPPLAHEAGRGAARQQDGGGGGGGLAFGRRAGKPPPSPAILRGDLPSAAERKAPQAARSSARDPAVGQGGKGGASSEAATRAGMFARDPPSRPEALRRAREQRQGSSSAARE